MGFTRRKYVTISTCRILLYFFTLTNNKYLRLFSVALSLKSLSLDVIQHYYLEVPGLSSQSLKLRDCQKYFTYILYYNLIKKANKGDPNFRTASAGLYYIIQELFDWFYQPLSFFIKHPHKINYFFCKMQPIYALLDYMIW